MEKLSKGKGILINSEPRDVCTKSWDLTGYQAIDGYHENSGYHENMEIL